MKSAFTLTRLSTVVGAALILAAAAIPAPSFAAERFLAGVKIFSPINVVLRHFGDPTFITSGSDLAVINYTWPSPVLIEPSGTGAASTMNSDTMGGMQQRGGQMPGAGYSGSGSQGQMLQRPNGEGGGQGQMGGMGQYGQVSSTSLTDGNWGTFDPLFDKGSRYYYNDAKHALIYEFVASAAGRVIEIKLFGYQSSYKTSEGIGLGANYAQIVLKYGYPEKTINTPDPFGDIVTLIYAQSEHVNFKLVRNRLAAISVIAPD